MPGRKMNPIANLAGAVMALALLACPAAAVQSADFNRSQPVFSCDIDARSPGNWVPEQMLIQIGVIAGQAIVVDPVIEFVNDGPIAVPIRQTANGGLRLTWTLNAPTDNYRKLAAAYTVEFRRDTFKGTVRVNLAGNSGGRNWGKLSCAQARFKR